MTTTTAVRLMIGQIQAGFSVDTGRRSLGLSSVDTHKVQQCYVSTFYHAVNGLGLSDIMWSPDHMHCSFSTAECILKELDEALEADLKRHGLTGEFVLVSF